MEYVLFTETIKKLEAVADKSPSVLVAFSGGKDSLVCLDLARKLFKQVVCFYLYLVPGLACVEADLQRARDKYKVDILQYPSFLLPRFLKNRLYCSTHIKTAAALWEYGLHDIYSVVMSDTGINHIISGAKESDSLWRRTKFFKFYTREQVVYPLQKWRKLDVLAYCKFNGIELPDKVRSGSTGIDLSTPSILWLHDNHPDDFERLLEYFPYAGAVVKRREWYGVS